MKPIFLGYLIFILLCSHLHAQKNKYSIKFSADSDLLSLHYDHAPDKDDGHSAAADRTVLQTLFGMDWIKTHVIVVSGAYGKNAGVFNSKSDNVMNTVWNDCGGWLAAHKNHKHVVRQLEKRWIKTLQAGGDVWVKEGGQSDITAAVVKCIQTRLPDLKTIQKIHVVQHGQWNEDQTTEAALAYTQKHTHYIRIRNANTYLGVAGGDPAFEKAATGHPVFGKSWKAAFAYYNPRNRLDFSDTAELIYILGLDEIDIQTFKKRYLDTVSKKLK